jgi:signal transduction histidine kinase
MAIILDKIILFFFCLFCFLFVPIEIETIICVLIAISVSSFSYYFHTKKVTAILIIIYYGLCLINPWFCIFLPLIAYDVAYHQLKLIGMAGLMLLLYNWYGNQVEVVSLGISAVLLAVLLQYRTKRYDKLHWEYKSLRDTSQELNMYLSNKNRMLIENQDYEIHLATLQERNRIAREIHDNVGHMLSRSLLQVGAMMAIGKDEALLNHLRLLKETLNDAMNSIRESVHELHDDSIDLKSNIKSIIDNFPDYKIFFDYDMSEHVAKNIKYSFIMIIKEALSNVTKHSNADTIDIIVREHPVFYQLLIKDNGKLNHKKISDTGIGLESMKTRVKSLNGNITIDNQDGFKIFISIHKKENKREEEEG